MQDDERIISIHFGVKRSKVKVTIELSQHFDSDTIALVVFNVQLSCFIHRQEEDTYISLVKGKGHNETLSTLWF